MGNLNENKQNKSWKNGWKNKKRVKIYLCYCWRNI